jgi:hypothetical protein
MPSDRSLDEFAGADDGADDEDTGDSSEDVNDSDTGPNGDLDDVEPATSTAAWSTEDTCDRCGEPTQRSWYEDGALVCAGCKSW